MCSPIAGGELSWNGSVALWDESRGCYGEVKLSGTGVHVKASCQSLEQPVAVPVISRTGSAALSGANDASCSAAASASRKTSDVGEDVLSTEGALHWGSKGHTVALRNLPSSVVEEAVQRQIATPWGGDPLYQPFADSILQHAADLLDAFRNAHPMVPAYVHAYRLELSKRKHWRSSLHSQADKRPAAAGGISGKQGSVGSNGISADLTSVEDGLDDASTWIGLHGWDPSPNGASLHEPNETPRQLDPALPQLWATERPRWWLNYTAPDVTQLNAGARASRQDAVCELLLPRAVSYEMRYKAGKYHDVISSARASTEPVAS